MRNLVSRILRFSFAALLLGLALLAAGVANNNLSLRQLSVRIAREAALDFRVTDLYLQRIAFLLAAGQSDLVRPRWVERALAAQDPSGGWLFNWYGWAPTPYKFGFDDVPSSHATGQGLWLSYLLKHRYPGWIQRHYPS